MFQFLYLEKFVIYKSVIIFFLLIFSAKKFIAPILTSPVDEIDIDNIFNSQLSSVIARSPNFSQTKTPNCFQVPILPKKSNSALQRQLNKSTTVAPLPKSFQDQLNKVDEVVSLGKRTSDQKLIHEKSFYDSRFFDTLQTNHKQSSDSSNFVSKTPKQSHISSLYASKKESFDMDIITNSDDEYQGEIYGPSLQTPNRITLPSIVVPNNYLKSEEQLRSIDEIRILLFSFISFPYL